MKERRKPKYPEKTHDDVLFACCWDLEHPRNKPFAVANKHESVDKATRKRGRGGGGGGGSLPILVY